jgi:heavy metal translocating P-type ATPase
MKRVYPFIYFAFSFIFLFFGFHLKDFWRLSIVLGLGIISVRLVLSFKKKFQGADLLALISLLGAFYIGEFFAGAVITLMLSSGGLLEAWAEGRASNELKSLLSRVPSLAAYYTPNGILKEINVKDVKVGMELQVRVGEIVPTDGFLIESATLDESSLTGESVIVERVEGGLVRSGVVNAGESFRYRVSKSADDSTYWAIVKLVKEALASSSAGVGLANKLAISFIPFVFLACIITWMLTGSSERVVAVLVAATPCPLILAVPIALVAGLSRAAKLGVVIKGGSALENLAKSQVVILDKTGTLTRGGPRVSGVEVREGYSITEVLAFAGSVESYSKHSVAKNIVKEVLLRGIELYRTSNVVEKVGQEITGEVDFNGSKLLVTVGRFREANLNDNIFSDGVKVKVEVNGEIVGVITMDDPVRAEAQKFILDLKSFGIERIILLTGDHQEVANKVAVEVGIEEVFSDVTPEGKLAFTKNLMESGKRVLVVGDGINDAPMLAMANVGVAMGFAGSSAASEAADVVVVEDSIYKVMDGVKLAIMVRSKAIEAGVGGMLLSVILMVLGGAGIVSAGGAALGQEFIDLLAIGWALTALKAKI